MPVEFPKKLQCLFEPARYKVLYGGRGGAKSWGVARALLLEGVQRPLRILCAREIQKSIADSVHQLLKDQIVTLKLEDFYEVLNNEIRGRNGSLFTFAGLKHNIANIKSKEGLGRVWIEEAEGVSKNSWDTLIPTIREDGSEIWITFNPQLDTDETYKRFVLNPPPGAVVVKLNWSDNPWFPEVLRAEKDDLRAKDRDAYLNVWEGNCRQTIEGAIFANELRETLEAGRITRVPYDLSKPVSTFWDLGKRDFTSIWFAQTIGFEFRLIDYLQDRGQVLQHYIRAIKNKPYAYADHWLPHDAQNDLLGNSRTIEQQARDAELNVRIVPRTSVADRINAARTVFNRCYFDENSTADGLQALRHWRFRVDPETGIYSDKPIHDGFDGADAFTYFAVAMEEADTSRKPTSVHRGTGSWMG